MYEPRTYRQLVAGKDLATFPVMVEETDLLIRADRRLVAAGEKAVRACRNKIERHARSCPDFLTALEPMEIPDHCPGIVAQMYRAGMAAGVGPMAAVAGAVAEYVGRALLRRGEEVIVENGGDVFMRSLKERIVSIYAGESPFTNRIGLRVPAERTPIGICTSSGTVGHSKSFGNADAVVVAAEDTALADAAATAIANRVQSDDDVDAALNHGRAIEGIVHVVVIKGSKLGVWGDLEIVPMRPSTRIES
jgi:ApbE superfamily uncharacterized protein (UPF0280 family)